MVVVSLGGLLLQTQQANQRNHEEKKSDFFPCKNKKNDSTIWIIITSKYNC